MHPTLRRLAAAALMLMAAHTLTVATTSADTPAADPINPDTAQPMLGEMAADFTLRGVDGTVLSLKDLRGKVVVIHFGASW